MAGERNSTIIPLTLHISNILSGKILSGK